MNPKNPLILAACYAAFAVCLCPSAQGAPAADKSAYTFFNPTPRDQMRELSTDRPDKTESAYTVDAGHFQIEADLIAYSRDHDTADGADVKSRGTTFANVNLKAGLTNTIDLQFVIETYTTAKATDRTSGLTEKASGFGDITTRLKINLWGNDSGDTAFALMPYVKFPTNQDNLGNNSIEGGLIAPYALSLPGGWGCGIMPQIDLVRDDDDSGYHTELVFSVTASHDITEKLGGYLELWASRGTQSGAQTVATFDCGLTYAVNHNTQLDLGVNLGISDAAEDIAPFVGLSMRF